GLGLGLHTPNGGDDAGPDLNLNWPGTKLSFSFWPADSKPSGLHSLGSVLSRKSLLDDSLGQCHLLGGVTEPRDLIRGVGRERPLLDELLHRLGESEQRDGF